MKSRIIRDKKKRELVLKNLKTQLLLNFLYKNQNLPKKVRFSALLKLSQFPKNAFKTRVRNRCVLTGRARAIFPYYRLSRVALRKKIMEGVIPGIQRSSW